MIYLDDKADTFPAGLFGTPFEAVYKALRAVAADVWAVDPAVYRAGMAWGWYALHKPEKLVGFRDIVTAALISAFAPMIKNTQTDAELLEYLRQWREYVPTFGRLQALYALFGAVVDIQPITDPESQAVIPVEDTRLAFYVRITEVDFSRPLSLNDAREIALRATPLGSRPYVYYALESRTQIPVAAIPQAPEVFVENWEIATPAVALPEVSVNNNFGEYNWLATSTDAVESISANSNTTNLGYSAPRIFPDYDDTKSYGIVQWQVTGGTTAGRVEFSIVNASGKFQVHNNTNGTLSFYQAKVAVCSDSTATVVTVYNSSKTAYNAFKFTLNNTPYYYVIDGTHDTWTDNLSAWGYSEVQPAPVLPEVVLVGDSTQDYWLYPSSSLSGSVTIAANGTHELYQSSGTFPGRSSYPQAMIVYQSTSGTNAGYTGFEPTEVQYSGVNVYGCKNISGGSLTLARIKIAKCYSLSATVVTVYNSSNVAYNAFKYTANNTDYYYVLDRTQTDWTDDLSSIGYALRAWTYNIRLDYGISTKLLDSNGQEIQYDSSKTYTVVGLYGSNGNSIANASGYIQYSSIFGQDGVLYYKQIYGNTTIVSVRYTVS